MSRLGGGNSRDQRDIDAFVVEGAIKPVNLTPEATDYTRNREAELEKTMAQFQESRQWLKNSCLVSEVLDNSLKLSVPTINKEFGAHYISGF